MDEPTRNEWMKFSEALDGYLEARDVANTTDDFHRRGMARTEMRDCAAQMDYLVSRGNDEHE